MIIRWVRWVIQSNHALNISVKFSGSFETFKNLTAATRSAANFLHTSYENRLTCWSSSAKRFLRMSACCCWKQLGVVTVRTTARTWTSFIPGAATDRRAYRLPANQRRPSAHLTRSSHAFMPPPNPSLTRGQ